ncbi:MAG: OB-fold domain-containing protein [Halobacteriota archaeon]
MVGKEQDEIEKELSKVYVALTYAEYEEGLKEGKLLGLKCAACGGITCHPMPVCQWCSDRRQEKVELSGEGEVTTFTVIRVASEGFEAEVPYIPCLVRTKEGPAIIGRLDFDAEHISQDVIGKSVKMSGAHTYNGDKFFSGVHVCPVFKIVE